MEDYRIAVEARCNKPPASSRGYELTEGDFHCILVSFSGGERPPKAHLDLVGQCFIQPTLLRRVACIGPIYFPTVMPRSSAASNLAIDWLALFTSMSPSKSICSSVSRSMRLILSATS